MLVSQTAEYALRSMAYLVNLPEGTPATSRDVARATGIPENYAAKVLRRMVHHGLLFAQKGHHGGFQLAHPPEKVRFLDVLEAIGEEVISDRCAFGKPSCNAREPCLLHESVSALRAQVSKWAESTTLASLRRRDPR